jgi:hypothetical protein
VYDPFSFLFNIILILPLLDGTLYCARDGETITFVDGTITRECSCEFTPDPLADPIRNCTTGPPSPVGPPSVSGQCLLPDANGEIVEFQNGDSFGELIEGACGPATLWPSFCRVLDDKGNFEFEYPYCVYNDAADSQVVCAEEGEVVSYIDINNVQQTCNCTITTEGIPESDCTESPTTRPPLSPTTSPPTFAPPSMALSISSSAGWNSLFTASILVLLAIYF